MAVPVYSTRFIQVRGLDGAVTYTCPDGYVAVVRDLDAYHGATGAESSVYLIGAGGQTLWENDNSVVDASYSSWRGRQVFYEGESIQVSANDSTDVTVSGYLLSLP